MNRDWKYFFYEISKIPRKSGSEEKIKDYLVDYAREKEFKYYTDKQNNVVIWKDASEGYNKDEIIGMQAHIDMVCEKTKNSKHDFKKDPIEIIEEDGFIKAKDTSLGADNGIGVAYILAILDSSIIKHPKIEAIFTTEEETTMNGVRFIDESVLKSKRIISFDNFNEKEMWIGSASSQEWYTELQTNTIVKEDVKTYEISLSNFIGGHAGMDIGDEKRGNPIKVAFELLKDTHVYITKIQAGSLINVIPRDCLICFNVAIDDNKSIDKIKENIKFVKQKFINEQIELNEAQYQTVMMDEASSKNIINCINDFKNGAINRENNNVVVGANLSKIKYDTENVNLDFCVRGNVRSLTDKYIENLKANIIEKYELVINKYDEWCGYEQSRDNELIKVCEDSYVKVTNDKPNILGVQACLECEFLGEKIKDLQYVAIGTNTFDVHSVHERIEVKSIERTWKIIVEILNYYFKR